MSTTTSDQATKPADQTFRHYAPSQAQNYAQYRSPYPQQLMSTIIDLHTSSSPNPESALTTVVDVGCGPGPATRVLASSFQNAIGLDPGESMIATAKSLGGNTKSGNDIQFAISGAEGIDDALRDLGVWDGEHPSVDLVTAATAAHWFNMPAFLASAAKVLKPGSSVIVWASGNFHIDRKKYPAEVADKVQGIMEQFGEEVMRPHELEGNRLCRELYKNLQMPWDLDFEKQKELGLDVFDKQKSFRKTWNEDGKFEEDLENGWMWSVNNKWAFIKMAMGTASPVTRFREHHREALEKGGMVDPVDEAVEKIRDAVGRDVEAFQGGMDSVVIVVKKKT